MHEANEGSSPLTRGKQDGVKAPSGRIRLIPAHAGKTTVSVAQVLAYPAHPRSRGENRTMPTMIAKAVGSSPLTRGKHDFVLARRLDVGLIPAHAGKTSHHDLSKVRTWAHPRSRGENSPSAAVSPSGWGSSPLTRGKHVDIGFPDGTTRLIPAHAGKTNAVSGIVLRSGAHPRSRGENSFFIPGGPRMRGSSPLTRGKRCLGGRRSDLVRLIPAHAGKTRQR